MVFFCTLIAGIAIYLTGFLDDIFRAISADCHWGEYRIRLQLAREGIHGFIHRHPFIGVGVSDVYRYTSHYLHWAVHNAFIEAADAVGILGFFFLYCIIIVYILQSYQGQPDGQIAHKYLDKPWIIFRFYCIYSNDTISPVFLRKIYLGLYGHRQRLCNNRQKEKPET